MPQIRTKQQTRLDRSLAVVVDFARTYRRPRDSLLVTMRTQVRGCLSPRIQDQLLFHQERVSVNRQQNNDEVTPCQRYRHFVEVWAAASCSDCRLCASAGSRHPACALGRIHRSGYLMAVLGPSPCQPLCILPSTSAFVMAGLPKIRGETKNKAGILY